MAENILIDADADKATKYQDLQVQLVALCKPEASKIANMANITAALKTVFGFFWVGFYTVDKNELLLGPFQGPIACTRITFGRGVCGKAWELGHTVLVPDVNAFPGHIACSSLSKSEVVVCCRNTAGKICAVLDVDSDELNFFDQTDVCGLEQLMDALKFVFDYE